MRLRALVILGALLFGATPVRAAPTVAPCLDASERGQVLRDQGALLRAGELFATLSSESCPAPVRDACLRGRLAAVESLPSIISR